MLGLVLRLRPLALALIMASLAASCGTGKKEDEEYVEGTVEQLYNGAMNALLNEQFTESAKLFDEVERQHPYSVWATKAQLMAAYAHYRDRKYDEALVSLDRFIQLHPGNRDAPYAHFMRGLSYYEQIADARRDQRMSELARDAFQEVMRRFPDSKYARDSREKLDLIHDHLAGNEMEIGRFYLHRGLYLAAINRFRKVVDDYGTTTHVAEALHRLVESYSALGLKDEAQKAAAVLGHNFPESEWYADSYGLVQGVKVTTVQKDDGSFLDWLF